jgi:hypothetical protein
MAPYQRVTQLELKNLHPHASAVVRISGNGRHVYWSLPNGMWHATVEGDHLSTPALIAGYDGKLVAATLRPDGTFESRAISHSSISFLAQSQALEGNALLAEGSVHNKLGRNDISSRRPDYRRVARR